ncbi:MAG: prepilin peptidase [Syntrophales bacterium]|jgi:leader peptidase (prepilin peptidase)/N-methyltransferase|nr:prepilin peptidase [Syntrophales bacterium]MCK9391144.1 prepilin peptidase [Syntrophales bacterium]
MVLWWAIVVFILGAVVGSFLNVCIHRLPREESIVFPSSRCPHCRHAIAWYDNIPLFSYIFLRGRCRSCQETISGRYFFIEALTAVMALFTYWKFGISLAFLAAFLFVATLIVITFIDIEHQIIPHKIVLPGIPVFLLAAVFIMGIPLIDAFLGIMIGIASLYLVAVYYEQITGTEGMGGGDVNLMGMLGAFLGWKALLFVLMTGAFIGAAVGIIMMIKEGKTMKYAVPFGPFLSLGAVVYLFWGRAIVNCFS